MDTTKWYMPVLGKKHRMTQFILYSGSEDNSMAWLFDIRNNYHISTILKVMEVSMDGRISHLNEMGFSYVFRIIL